MAQKFANVIIDISHESVDRVFQYCIPPPLEQEVAVGCLVQIPFGSGNRMRKGYVVDITSTPEYDVNKLKDLAGIVAGSVSAKSQLICLAWWMKERYGSTMNQALKTVLPVRQKVKPRQKRVIRVLLEGTELKEAIAAAAKKQYKARARLLTALSAAPVIPYEVAVMQMNLTQSTLRPMEEQGLIRVEATVSYRNPVESMEREGGALALNQRQRDIACEIAGRYDRGDRKPSLIYGVTGSGKTEIYMELICHVLEGGGQVIMLIPEISLTYQTVMRFYQRFGDRVSVMNSRMSAGERYDQYERAANGDIDIMIGPRSALFTPFERLGLIIMDEEHESAYKSELSPRYHARDASLARASQCGAAVVLGSATPSLESYTRALEGQYCLYTLKDRAKESSRLPQVEVVDLRRELREGNKSIFSRILKERMEERLREGMQIMLFINRRGYAGFVSCRSCGEAVRCPHCDVTLTLHGDGMLRCHYCGHAVRQPVKCPVCGSPYIAPFGTGTQKIEAMTRQMFPQARVLRMDADTTSRKGGHQEILAAFAQGEADVLIGTQMIVKGHDFPNVTLVGVLAADLSLYAPDYRSAERTFQLLTQAAGRAGRGSLPGDVVIQTYQPDHYGVRTAANQDYEAFYQQEMSYRRLLGYPPVCGLLTVQLSSAREERLEEGAKRLAQWLAPLPEDAQMIGPVSASVYKVNDIYRKILYIKHKKYDILIQIRVRAEELIRTCPELRGLMAQYDLSEQ